MIIFVTQVSRKRPSTGQSRAPPPMRPMSASQGMEAFDLRRVVCIYFFTNFGLNPTITIIDVFFLFFQVLSAKQVEEQIKATELEQTSFESSIASRWENFYFFAWDLEAIIDKLPSTRLEMFML